MERSADWVRAVEAAYEVEQPVASWLGQVVEAMRPIMRDQLGMKAYVYDASTRPFTLHAIVVDGVLDAEQVASAIADSDEAYVKGSWLARQAAMGSETPGFADHPGVRDVFHPAGIRDVLAVNALDPTGIGCLVGALMRQERRLDEATRVRFERVSAHLQAALRLRRRIEAEPLARPSDDGDNGAVEAIFDRRGRVEHLDTEALRADPQATTSLREAVLDLERARARRGGEAALDAWRVLVRTRWSLVHSFEAGSAQYVVARANVPKREGSQALSARERDVVRCLALGHRQKVVAYELGIAPSTVRVLIARARRKLGARDLPDLIDKFRAVNG